MRALLLMFLVTTVACATPAAASSPSGFSYAGSLSSEEAPPAPTPSPGLIVRPDEAVFSVALTVSAPDCQLALEALHRAADDLNARLRAATQGTGLLRLQDLDLAELRGGTSRAGEPSRATGVVEVALAPDADYWARMQLLLRVAQVFGSKPDGNEKAPGVEAVLSRATFRVKDVEHYRDALTQAWVKRVRAFEAAAQSPGTPLHVAACEPPGEIEQTSQSAEEVALQLPIVCHLQDSKGETAR